MKHTRRFFVLFGIFILVMGVSGMHSAIAADKIDINKASVEELTQLKGIGQKIAERIVEYRKTNGPFGKPEAIMDVKGIGSKTFENNKDLIIVGKVADKKGKK